MPNEWTVPELWPDNTAYIIGGGSSLNTTGLLPTKENASAIIAKMNEDLVGLKDHRVIGVNDAYLLGSWVDVCWFGDVRWYEWNREKLLEFKGLKTCCCPTLAAPERPGIKVLKRSLQLGLTEDKQTVKWNKSSGTSALNLAVHFGVKKIVLLGFDMYIGKDGYHNWHDNHLVSGHSPANPYTRFMQPFVNIAVDAKRLGVEIINCNLESDITQFKKKALEEVV